MLSPAINQANDIKGAVAQKVLLIIGGGIAAYKSLELIRRLRERACDVRVVLTRAAQEFVTPLSAGALSNDRVFTDLFDLDDEREIGHIRLSRDADLVIVAPATADLLAKMATGQAGDLATAVLLATDKPVLVAPAMNPRMWEHPATRRNVQLLASDGIHFIGPKAGEMAERGEAGVGRMAEASEIADAVLQLLGRRSKGALCLAGRHVVVTSGPTHEPIDPVRYIANRSSGKQGHAIAAAAALLGARVTLVSGPVALANPVGVDVIKVETAAQMLEAVQSALPADIAICAAAVADWHVASAAGQKMKKSKDGAAPTLALAENADILKTLARSGPRRPGLVIGFAAETENVIAHGQRKRKDKGADWIVANDVSPSSGTFGGDRNTVHLITADGFTSWPPDSKDGVARLLVEQAADWLSRHQSDA
jgi:phosphopantothenoylcysteine decarboxylase/phosphopantothenate--cysteine ligase